MARVALPESKIRARRRKRRIITVSIVVAALVAIVGSLVWLSWASFLRITVIQVTGEQTISQSEIADFVRKELMGSYLYLFAKNNIFLYPKTKIEEALPEAMPVVASAEVYAINFHTVGVTIVERQPKALWCGEDSAADSGSCLLLDQNGAAYGPVNNGFLVSGQDGSSGYKHYYGALIGTSTPKQYLTPEEFSALGALVDAIVQSQQQDPITSISVDQNDDVRVVFESGFKLLFALSADGGDVYSRFMLALQSDAFQGHSIADFQYLDLRFGDRLYYKLKGQ